MQDDVTEASRFVEGEVRRLLAGGCEAWEMVMTVLLSHTMQYIGTHWYGTQCSLDSLDRHFPWSWKRPCAAEGTARGHARNMGHCMPLADLDRSPALHGHVMLSSSMYIMQKWTKHQSAMSPHTALSRSHKLL